MCSLQGVTSSHSDDGLFLPYKVNGAKMGGGDGAALSESLTSFILRLSR